MASIRIATDELVLALQWALAVVLFESGLAQAGLPLDGLEARLGLPAAAGGVQALAVAGAAQAVAAVLLVVPTLTRFLPAVTPLVAFAVAVAFGAAGSGSSVPVGLGEPSLATAVALAAGVLAVARGVLLPVAALDLGPETRDPWLRPAAQLDRLRRHEQASGASALPGPTRDPAASRRPGAAPRRAAGLATGTLG